MTGGPYGDGFPRLEKPAGPRWDNVRPLDPHRLPKSKEGGPMLEVQYLRERDVIDNAETERRRAAGEVGLVAERFRDFYGGLITVAQHARQGQVSLEVTFGAKYAEPWDVERLALALRSHMVFLPAVVAKALGERLVKEAEAAIEANPEAAGRFVDG